MVLHVCSVDSREVVKVRCPSIFESKFLEWKYSDIRLSYVKNNGQKKLPNGNACNDGYAAVHVSLAVSIFHLHFVSNKYIFLKLLFNVSVKYVSNASLSFSLSFFLTQDVEDNLSTECLELLRKNGHLGVAVLADTDREDEEEEDEIVVDSEEDILQTPKRKVPLKMASLPKKPRKNRRITYSDRTPTTSAAAADFPDTDSCHEEEEEEEEDVVVVERGAGRAMIKRKKQTTILKKQRRVCKSFILFYM